MLSLTETQMEKMYMLLFYVFITIKCKVRLISDQELHFFSGDVGQHDLVPPGFSLAPLGVHGGLWRLQCAPQGHLGAPRGS